MIESFLKPDNFGALFICAIFFLSMYQFYKSPKEFFIIAAVILGVAALPYGVWCLYGWNGIHAFNAFMLVVAVASNGLKR